MYEVQMNSLQELCRQNNDCFWFTHYTTQCYLLKHCGDLAR